MQVDVRQEHIDAGTRGDTRGCAIARALQDMGFKDISVGPFAAFIEGKAYMLSHEASKFVYNFDTGREQVKPVTLTLSPYFADRDQLGMEMAYAPYAKMPWMGVDIS